MTSKTHRIAVGSDHRGFALKQQLIKHDQIGSHAIIWADVGTFSEERTDYPLYAKKVVELLKSNQADLGLLLCGSGIGIAIAANRYPGMYAGIAWNEKVAASAREDDNVNILVIPADYVNFEEALPIIHAWLSATFKGGRYQERLTQVDSL